MDVKEMTKKIYTGIRSIRWIELNISEYCNLQCSFCPKSEPDRYPNEKVYMDIDLIKKITDDVIQYRYSKKLAFCGRGEPSIHKQIEECLSILNRPDRTYESYMVTNGATLKKNWQFIKQLDGLEINTYSTKDKYEERIKRYRVLDNGRPVTHSYKPSDKGREEDLSTVESYTFTPTNRGGFFSPVLLQNTIYNHAVCTVPKYWIFIDANGDYSLCCDDWKYKHKIDSVYDKNLFDIYLNNEKLKSIKRELHRGNRTCTLACSECTRRMY